MRTLVQFVPVAGGAISQAWSEYDSFKQNQRVDSFFIQLADHIQRLQFDQDVLKENIKNLEDAAELLERCVEAAQREASDPKRPVYSRLYCSFISNPSETTEDERINLIQEIEQLTSADLTLLSKFAQHRGVMRGDMITATVQVGWTAVGAKPSNTQWLQQHGTTVHSIAKLIGRGLLTETEFNASFSYSGDSGSSFNRFRQCAWAMTPIAFKLLKYIQPK
jgi:hypothetical protein